METLKPKSLYSVRVILNFGHFLTISHLLKKYLWEQKSEKHEKKNDAATKS